MRRFSRTFTSLAVLGLLGSAACRDQIPTFTDDARFPGQVLTIEHVVPVAELLIADTVFADFSDVQDLGALVVANQFGTAPLQANALAGFEFPDSIVYFRGGAQVADSVFDYVEGELFAILQPAVSRLDDPIELQFWEVPQEWDTTATWTTARAAEPWQMPGGTRGALLGSLALTPTDTFPGDTIRLPLDAATLERMAAEGAHGVVITAAGAPARVQLASVFLNATVRPATHSDTLVVWRVLDAGRRIVFTPEPPVRGPFWPVGGVRSARTVLTLRLPAELPGCLPGAPGACPPVPIRQAQLNQVALLLDTQPFADGFQPLSTQRLQIREILEPQLGPRAPLGGFVGGDTLTVEAFAQPGGQPVAVLLGRDFARRVITRDDRTATVSLLADPEGAFFGMMRFAETARLRIIYTIVPEPVLP